MECTLTTKEENDGLTQETHRLNVNGKLYHEKKQRNVKGPLRDSSDKPD